MNETENVNHNKNVTESSSSISKHESSNATMKAMDTGGSCSSGIDEDHNATIAVMETMELDQLPQEVGTARLGVTSLINLGDNFFRPRQQDYASLSPKKWCYGNDGTTTAFFLETRRPSLDSCAGSDGTVILLICIAVHAINWFLRKKVWEPLSQSESKTGRWAAVVQSVATEFVVEAYFLWKTLSTMPSLSGTITGGTKFLHFLVVGKHLSELLMIDYKTKNKEEWIKNLAGAANHLSIAALVLVLDRFGYPYLASLFILALSIEGTVRPILFVANAAHEVDQAVAAKLKAKLDEKRRQQRLMARRKKSSGMLARSILKDLVPGYSGGDGDDDGAYTSDSDDGSSSS